jgi:hypothetical protein
MPKIVVLRNNGSNNDGSYAALEDRLTMWCDDIVAEPSAMRHTTHADSSRSNDSTHPL